jgi:hypothetical protein
MTSQLDEAFNWLVLILSTIASALSQFPDLYPFKPEKGVSLALLRLVVFPVVVLAFTWLWSQLAREGETKVVVKSLSWILASIILMADLMLLIFSAASPYYTTSGGYYGPPTIVSIGLTLLLLSSPLILPIPLCLRVIRPRMREIYKDSKFLYSLPKQILLYIATALLYLLVVGVIEGLLFPQLAPF